MAEPTKPVPPDTRTFLAVSAVVEVECENMGDFDVGETLDRPWITVRHRNYVTITWKVPQHLERCTSNDIGNDTRKKPI
jgi:hypothetical protein